MTYETWKIRYPEVVNEGYDVRWREFDIQDIVYKINTSLRHVCLVRDIQRIQIPIRDIFIEAVVQSFGEDIDELQPFIDIDQHDDDTVYVVFSKLYDFDRDEQDRIYIAMSMDSLVSMSFKLSQREKGFTSSVEDIFVSSTTFLDSARKEIVLPKISAYQQRRQITRDQLNSIDLVYTEAVRERYNDVPDGFFEPPVNRIEYIVNM